MILLSKQGDKFALEKLIKRFNPAINSNIKLIDSYKSLNKYDLEDNMDLCQYLGHESTYIAK
ncbi:hypothetical protein DDA98_14680 [Clostridium perfringens]|nr:hypothetical protein DDA98_14680 [Clostridium perfringens]